jgi:cytochrome c553
MPGFSTLAAPLVALAPALFAFAPAAQAATGPVLAPPAKLGLCAACHGEDGRSRSPGTPNLAGQDEPYLRRALTDFRSGARQAAPMNAVAGTLQPRDISALARWYATRPAGSKR